MKGTEKSEHQPCDQQPVAVKCSFAKCCWCCDKGYCHHFFVFGSVFDSCVESEHQLIKAHSARNQLEPMNKMLLRRIDG